MSRWKLFSGDFLWPSDTFKDHFWENGKMNIFLDDDIHLCNAFEGKKFFSNTSFCFHLRWPVKRNRHAAILSVPVVIRHLYIYNPEGRWSPCVTRLLPWHASKCTTFCDGTASIARFRKQALDVFFCNSAGNHRPELYGNIFCPQLSGMHNQGVAWDAFLFVVSMYCFCNWPRGVVSPGSTTQPEGWASEEKMDQKRHEDHQIKKS